MTAVDRAIIRETQVLIEIVKVCQCPECETLIALDGQYLGLSGDADGGMPRPKSGLLGLRDRFVSNTYVVEADSPCQICRR